MSLIPRKSLFDFDHLFDNFWAPLPRSGEGSAVAFAPRVDIKEKGDHYEISAELPGIDKKDIHVSLDNGVLTIEAEAVQEDKEEKDGKIIRQERRYGKFMRSFNLEGDVQESDIKATFDKGVLTLTAPRKAPAAPEKRRIEIQ